MSTQQDLTSLEKLEKIACVPPEDAARFRRALRKVDSDESETALKRAHASLNEIIVRHNHVIHFLDERNFLKSLPGSCSTDVDRLLMENLVHLVDAVINWRRLLSVPIPLRFDGRDVLFEILRECKNDLSLATSSSPVVSPRLRNRIGENALSLSSSHVLSRQHAVSPLSTPKGLLTCSGYFPYSLSAKDELQEELISPSDGRPPHLAAIYKNSLRYLQFEHQRQVTRCKKQLDCAQRQDHLMMIEFYNEFVAFASIHAPVRETGEITQLLSKLRSEKRRFSDEQKVALGLLYDQPQRRLINVKGVLGNVSSIPAYVVAANQCAQVNNTPLHRILEMVIVYSHLRTRFSLWWRFAELRRQCGVAKQLQWHANRLLIKYRLVTWYRFVSWRQSQRKKRRLVPPHGNHVGKPQYAGAPTSAADDDMPCPSGRRIEQLGQTSSSTSVHTLALQTGARRKMKLLLKLRSAPH